MQLVAHVISHVSTLKGPRLHDALWQLSFVSAATWQLPAGSPFQSNAQGKADW